MRTRSLFLVAALVVPALARGQTSGLPALRVELEAETAARMAADDGERGDRQAADAAEAAARAAADQAEAAARAAAVKAEAGARGDADAALGASLAAETSRAMAAEADLQRAIGAIPAGPPGPPGAGVTGTWSWFPKVPPPYQPILLPTNVAGRKRIIATTIPVEGAYLIFATMRYYAQAEWLSLVCDVVDARNYYNEGLVNAAALPSNPGAVSGTLTLHAAYGFPAGMIVEVACEAWAPAETTVQLDQLLLSAILVNDPRAGTPQE
jgi:hypothetical protein